MSMVRTTILIPNYKTLMLTKLCLQLLQKYTNLGTVEVIVIDNDSQDDSLDFLRSVPWITLLERKSILGETPSQSHSRALDLALDLVKTPYVLSIHTDTLVKRADWLLYLIAELEKNPLCAGVGSWKLEVKPWWRKRLKAMEDYFIMLYYQIIGYQDHGIQGQGNNFYYLRSHCALYRVDALRKHNLHFSDGDKVAGKMMHKKLVEAGYQMVFLPSEILIDYLEHINHATVILNPSLSRRKSMNKKLRRVERKIKEMICLTNSDLFKSG